jgi:drug/metabolite transporter (DMT)-like permease
LHLHGITSVIAFLGILVDFIAKQDGDPGLEPARWTVGLSLARRQLSECNHAPQYKCTVQAAAAILLHQRVLSFPSFFCAATKAADQQTALDTYGNTVYFNHPFVQAFIMFCGEFLCLLAFYALIWRAQCKGTKIDRAKPFNPIIFLLPALCDMTATSTMYIGLALTDASIFQMLRGSVIIFTSLLSVIFLKRKLQAYHWIGIVLVIGGTALVGTQSKICPEADGATCPAAENSHTSMATIGNILIIVAQFIVAIQMVVEEKFISGYDVPALQVVGE